MLRGIHKLVEQGAVVAGEKPTDTPSLADDAAEFKKLNDELFGDGSGVHSVGKGKVYAGQNAEAALKAMNIAPDFDHTKPQSDTRILFVHRKLADADIYFVDNRNDRDETVDASFRIPAKRRSCGMRRPAKSEPASYQIADGRTTVPLHLEPWGTVFVVFRKPAKATSRHLAQAGGNCNWRRWTAPWNVSFQPGRGAPASVTLDKLTSWSDSQDKGVKYFSGTGTYTKTIQASAGLVQERREALD